MTPDPQTWLQADRRQDPDRTPSEEVQDADNRAARRHATAVEIGLMHIGDDHDFCRIRNISPTGLMAQIYRTVWVGDDVDIDLKCGLSLHGTVVWASDHVPPLASRRIRQIGVRFHEPVDIGPLLSSEIVTHTGTLQRWPRLIAGCPLRVVLQSGRQLSGRLCDISPQGAKFLSSQSLPGEPRVSLIVRGLPLLEGTVRWHQGPLVGMAFNKALPLEGLAEWIQTRRAEGLTEAGSSGAVRVGATG